MSAPASQVIAYDVYRVRIPLVTPYHLSKVYGTLTHSDVLILRVQTSSGQVGGEKQTLAELDSQGTPPNPRCKKFIGECLNRFSARN